MKKILILIFLIAVVLAAYVLVKGRGTQQSYREQTANSSAPQGPILKEFSSDNKAEIEKVYVEPFQPRAIPAAVR